MYPKWYLDVPINIITHNSVQNTDKPSIFLKKSIGVLPFNYISTDLFKIASTIKNVMLLSGIQTPLTSHHHTSHHHTLCQCRPLWPTLTWCGDVIFKALEFWNQDEILIVSSFWSHREGGTTSVFLSPFSTLDAMVGSFPGSLMRARESRGLGGPSSTTCISD